MVATFDSREARAAPPGWVQHRVVLRVTISRKHVVGADVGLSWLVSVRRVQITPRHSIPWLAGR